MQDITIVSPAMMKLYNDCAGKFYYRYIEQIPTPKLDKSFVIGKNIHALASYFLKGENISKLERVLSPKELEFWNYLKSNEYFNSEIVGVEKNITTKLGKYWIGGRIDALVKQNNDYFVLDYKTGGVSEDMSFDFQTMVYLYVSDILLKNYDSLYFVYLDLKNKREVKIKYTPQMKTEYIKRLTEICNNIESFDINKFGCRQDCVCEYSKIYK